MRSIRLRSCRREEERRGWRKEAVLFFFAKADAVVQEHLSCPCLWTSCFLPALFAGALHHQCAFPPIPIKRLELERGMGEAEAMSPSELWYSHNGCGCCIPPGCWELCCWKMQRSALSLNQNPSEGFTRLLKHGPARPGTAFQWIFRKSGNG